MDRCPICDIEKTLENTYRDKSRFGGLASWCKVCTKDRKETRYADWYKDYNLRKQIMVTKSKLRKYICIVCGVESESVRHRVTCGGDKCKRIRTRLCSLEHQRKSNAPKCTDGCGRGTRSKDGICKSCRKVRRDLEKQIERNLSRRVCRICGVGLQNRGNYYDFCTKCVPKLSCRIGYCRYCGKVLRGIKGNVCSSLICQNKYSFERTKKSKSLIDEYKKRLKKNGCIVCGYKVCITALEFHHLGGKKERDISRIKSLPKLRAEFENSDLVILCANCHREVHAGIIGELLLRGSIINLKKVISK